MRLFLNAIYLEVDSKMPNTLVCLLEQQLFINIIIINNGILSLTDFHHNHYGRNRPMVELCHGGNAPGNHHDDCDDDDNETRH